MSRTLITLLAVPVLQFALAAPAFADASAEKYVDDALPLMYHSCTSVVDEANGDEEYIEMAVRAMVAVSLYNRDVEISRFTISEEKKTALRDKFVAALKKGCEKDHDALLAGVVDDAVVHALASK